MNDNHRSGRHLHGSDRNRTPTDSDVERLIHSESPRAQKILLFQSLKEEIDKNAAGRVRYVDSELYFPNQRHSEGVARRASEVQTATLEIGTAQSTSRTQSRNYNNINDNNNLGNTKAFIASTSSKRNSRADVTMMEDVDLSSSGGGQDRHCKPMAGANCQVCLIREVKEGLVNVTKLVQERNEQLSKLKARHLRSFFERQMLD